MAGRLTVANSRKKICNNPGAKLQLRDSSQSFQLISPDRWPNTDRQSTRRCEKKKTSKITLLDEQNCINDLSRLINFFNNFCEQSGNMSNIFLYIIFFQYEQATGFSVMESLFRMLVNMF